MNRNLWAVTAISFLALCWATAFLGAGTQGLVASTDGFSGRIQQIEPDYRYDLAVALEERRQTAASVYAEL